MQNNILNLTADQLRRADDIKDSITGLRAELNEIFAILAPALKRATLKPKGKVWTKERREKFQRTMRLKRKIKQNMMFLIKLKNELLEDWKHMTVDQRKS